MASNKILERKKSQVADLTEKVQGSVAGILVDYKGITVAQDTKMRKELREANVEYSVIKNSLMSRAFDNVGYGELEDVLVGTTALAISEEDVIAPAKILAKYAKEFKGTVIIKGGYLDGKVVGLDDIDELANLPSEQELMAKVVGSLAAPISGLVHVLNGNIRGLVQVLGQIVEQQEQSA